MARGMNVARTVARGRTARAGGTMSAMEIITQHKAARTAARASALPKRVPGATLGHGGVKAGGYRMPKAATAMRNPMTYRPPPMGLPRRPGGAKVATARMGYPIKGAGAARRGSEMAKWVKSPRVRKAAMVGGIAAGGYGLARAVTKSGTGTDKTGYGQARGMYNY